MNSEKQTKIEQSAKILRNCRKIEHRIHQLEKQLYLGHTQAYGLIMETIHPNYKEHREEMRNKHAKDIVQKPLSGTPLKDSSVLAKAEKEISDDEKK